MCVNLLHGFQTISDWQTEWEPGVHGVLLRRGHKSVATFLPSVAAEQGWSRTETMEHLLMKGGLEPDLDTLSTAFTVQRYQSRSETLDHRDY